MNKPVLEALADRVEALIGPCRRLDALIEIAREPDRQVIVGAEPGRFPQKPIYGPVTELIPMAEHGAEPRDAADFLSAPAYTASLDAAMTLVPEGAPIAFMSVEDVFHAGLGNDQKGWAKWYAVAATPALALTAAALRARAAQ